MRANFGVVYQGAPGITWERDQNRFKVGYYQMRDILQPKDLEFQFQVRLDSKGRVEEIRYDNFRDGGQYKGPYTVKVNDDGKAYIDGHGEVGDLEDNKDFRFRKYKQTIKNRLREQENFWKTNEENKEANRVDQRKNEYFDHLISQAQRSESGKYLNRRGSLENFVRDQEVDGAVGDIGLSEFRNFYNDKIIKEYNLDNAADPLYGTFDSDWYLNEYDDVKRRWDRAVEEDDLDIISTYGGNPNTWAQSHFTRYGRYERRRGNAAESTTAANAYTLTAPTDAEIAERLDDMLGITPTQETSIFERLKEDSEVVSLWRAVRDGSDKRLNALAKANNLNFEKFTDFVTGLSLSQEDKGINELKARLFDEGLVAEGEFELSELEVAIEEGIRGATQDDITKFGALAQNVLRDTLDEMEVARQKEYALGMYSNFGGFGEVMDAGSNLTDSILGDSGIGGYLGFIGGKDTYENIENALDQVTGIGNIAKVNWEKWFEDDLIEKYSQDYAARFEQQERKRNVVAAALPTNADYVDYVTGNPDLNEAYRTYTLETSPEDRLSKAEWGRQHYEDEGKDNADLDKSMLDIQVTDPETGNFTEDFLRNARFESQEDMLAFLKETNSGKDILSTISPDGNWFSDAELEEYSPKEINLQNRLKNISDQIEKKDLDYDDLELQYEFGDDILEEIEIERQFVRDFIDDYLRPRFDYSRSMSEFRDYIEVNPAEQNPFQTQTMLDALKTVAQERADYYIEQAQGMGDQTFDYQWYFDPTEGYGAEAGYGARNLNIQKDTVQQAYDEAMAGKQPWKSMMYRYGVRIDYANGERGYNATITNINKDDFARMHYEEIGRKGITDPDNPEKTIKFRPAENVLDPNKVKRYIYYDVLPALEDEGADIGSVFGQFITPEEFADDVISSFNFEDDEEMREALAELGLDDFDGGIEELRETLMGVIASNDAIKIREGIKYLNEQGERPDQEELGIDYIEREEDYKPDIKPDSQLFKIFQSAGYEGTEKEFYDEFMPGQSMEDVQMLEGGLDFDFGDFKDPLSSLVSINKYFPDDEEAKIENTFGSEKDSYANRYKQAYSTDRFLTVNTNNDYGTDYDSKYADKYMSDAGKAYLGEFTSGFRKGRNKVASLF